MNDANGLFCIHMLLKYCNLQLLDQIEEFVEPLGTLLFLELF